MLKNICLMFTICAVYSASAQESIGGWLPEQPVASLPADNVCNQKQIINAIIQFYKIHVIPNGNNPYYSDSFSQVKYKGACDASDPCKFEIEIRKPDPVRLVGLGFNEKCEISKQLWELETPWNE